ncbi:hypothetical protein [Azospirillum sp. sgz302134]
MDKDNSASAANRGSNLIAFVKRDSAPDTMTKTPQMVRLSAQPVQIVGARWSRDDLYDE